MDIINCSLNTYFYYNISKNLDPSHSTISCNFVLCIYCSVYYYRNVSYCASRMRLFAAYFDINAARFVKFSLTSCCMRYNHTPTLSFIKLHNLF